MSLSNHRKAIAALYAFGCLTAGSDTSAAPPSSFAVRSDKSAIIMIPIADDHISPEQPDIDLGQPRGVAVDRAGNVFIVAWGHATVTEITAASGHRTTLTLSTMMSDAAGIAVDGDDNIFLANVLAGTVTEFEAAGGYAERKLLASGLKAPSGLAFDDAGTLFVAETGAEAVRAIHIGANGSPMETIPTPGIEPTGLYVDPSGNLFLAGSGTLKELLAADRYKNSRTLHVVEPTTDDHGMPLVGFGNHLTDVTLDHAGHAIFAECSYGHHGSACSIGMIATGQDDGEVRWLDAELGRVESLAIDTDSNIYVGDEGGRNNDASKSGAIREFLASDGYKTSKRIGGTFE